VFVKIYDNGFGAASADDSIRLDFEIHTGFFRVERMNTCDDVKLAALDEEFTVVVIAMFYLGVFGIVEVFFKRIHDGFLICVVIVGLQAFGKMRFTGFSEV
jgi:hypothetical protein